MYLNINPMTNYGKNFSYKEKSRKKDFISNVSFNRRLKIRKPAFANAEIQKVSNKIDSFLEKMPNFSAIKKPIQMPFKNGILGFTIDKTEGEISKISLKVKENSTKIKNWDSITEFDKGMDFVLNKKGQMTEGVYYEAGGCHLLYRRQPQNSRRILYKHNEYMPDSLEKYAWRRITGNEKIFSTHERILVDTEKIEVLFFELAESSTSFLVK